MNKRLWHKCGSAINRLFLWLFIAFAILLAVNLWILLISAIAILFDYNMKLLLAIKILSACAIVLVIFSHIALWQIMYSPDIYNQLISIVWHKRIRFLIFLVWDTSMCIFLTCILYDLNIHNMNYCNIESM